MEAGERDGSSDSEDGSSAASWVILNDDDHVSGEEDAAAAAGDDLPPVGGGQLDTSHVQRVEDGMDSSGDSAKTVTQRTDVSAGNTSRFETAQKEAGKLEEGSDVEVIPAEHTEDAYYEDHPIGLGADSAAPEGDCARPAGALPSETVLRQRWTGRDRDQDQDQDKRDGEEGDLEQRERPARPAAAVPADTERDRWADDTDLSSLTDQMVLEVSSSGRLRQYVHRRNNTVNHLLTVLLVLCVTCVLGLGAGHFLGWLQHHELTEEMVHTMDEKLDVLRDDLMTCMTTEDDQDLDNKWIKELLTENEALLQQLHHDEEQGAQPARGSRCSEAEYDHLRDQVNQLRMENEELRANIAKMRYGAASQDGYVLRRHLDQINQLRTENSELGRELRRSRYLQPPAGPTEQEEDPAQSADQPPPDTDPAASGDLPTDPATAAEPATAPTAPGDSPDLARSADHPETSASASADSEPDSESDSESESGSGSDSGPAAGLLSALLSWRPAPGSEPLQEARQRLWSLWQEASAFSRAEPVSRYATIAGRSLQKLEKTLTKALEKVQRLGREMLEDGETGAGRVEKVAAKLARKVDKVVARLDARWQEIRSNWEGKVAARESEATEAPSGLPPNDTDPSVAAFYARRSLHRQRARGEEDVLNWQLGRGRSRAELRGAFHDGSWLLKRAQARQQLRQRRGEEAEVPGGDQRWRQERAESGGQSRSDGRWRRESERSRREWRALDDDDLDDDDDDDDDYEDHADRLGKHMAANARFQERIQKTVQRHAAKVNKKVRENHWKHFGGRNRHEFRQRYHKF